MFPLFRALSDRVKALFLADAGLDIEAAFVARAAERKSDLLRQADRYDEVGQSSIAQELRQQAEALSLNRPLASVLPSVEHLLADQQKTLPSLFHDNTAAPTPVSSLSLRKPVLQKKGR